MSGGGKTEVFNTRERAVSNDQNRAQAFVQFDRAEILRRLYDNRLVGTILGGGVQELGSYVDTTAMDSAAVGTPLKADLFDGLVVLPIVGSMNLTVSPGCVLLDDPDGQAGSSDPNPPNPDDSRAKIVVDAGVQTLGTLVLSGGAGSTRIDVVECQRTQVVVETDNRDIFDPSTGLFSAVAVPKVVEGQLTYRVREGTPGAGFPGAVQGWLPLCVISVPASATVVEDCTFWDVRPLVKDRIGYDTQKAVGTLQDAQELIGDDITTPGVSMQYGFASSQIGMYRCGGLVDKIDLAASANQAAGYLAIAGEVWYLYALFPAGLPRWVKYKNTAPMIPQGPLGILTVASVPPSSSEGQAAALLVNAPVETGLSVSGPAALLAAGICDTDPKPSPVLMRDGLCRFQNFLFSPISPASSTATTDTYALVPGVHYPVNAKSVLLSFTASFTGTPGDSFFMSKRVGLLKAGTASSLFLIDEGLMWATFGAGTQAVTIVMEVPTLPLQEFIPYANNFLNMEFTWNQSVGTKGSPAVFVGGWRI